MKMTLNEISEHAKNLSALTKCVFPVKLGFAISTNLERLASEHNRKEKERIKLCERYAEKNEDGTAKTVGRTENGRTVKIYDIAETSQKLLYDELEELDKTEVDIPIHKVKVDVVEQCEMHAHYEHPSVQMLAALSFMIEE